jgi:DNA-binding SARP family transcriptional activator
MYTGPCGIACSVCRYYLCGQCQCRAGGDLRPTAQVTHGLCPVLQCARARNIAYCTRDCIDFPCVLLECTVPHRWPRLSARSSSDPVTDSITSDSPKPLEIPADVGQAQHDYTLRVYCLGQFRVFRGDVELHDGQWGRGKGPTQKIKALLAFLLCRKTQGARKETLIDLLWPQQNDLRRASSSFHQALFHLRRALEPELASRAASSYVRRLGERYYFDPHKPTWVDADAFVYYTNRAQALEREGDSAAAQTFWNKAIDLYGGDYMAGIDVMYTRSHFYDWCAPRCHHLKQLFLNAKMAVASHSLAGGQHHSAIEHAQEALTVEPALEAAHRLLMQCMLETGQIDNALSQYRVCEAELAWHQDRLPSQPTRLLYQQLVKGSHSN